MNSKIVSFVLVSILLSLSVVVGFLIPVKAHPAEIKVPDSHGVLGPEFVRTEIIVKFKSSLRMGWFGNAVTCGIRSIDELNKRFKAKKVEEIFSRVYKLSFPEDADVISIAREYERDPNIEYIEPNYVFHTSVVPNDPEYSKQWAHQVIESEAAWDMETGSPDVTIAVVDTGVDWDHPDLAANIWNNPDEVVDGRDTDGNGYIDDVRGYDFVDTDDSVYPGEDGTTRDNDPMDFDGHGTHCAGIAAAVANNRIGVAGVSWNSKIMAVRAGYKAADGVGYLEEDDIALAIVYAADNGANIISMSWGDFEESALIREAVKYAYDRGVLLVAAAGNDATSIKHFPAAYDEVVAVTATDEHDDPAGWTNFGDWVELGAPGVDIYSTVWDDSYAYKSGTSMSTPHVAGVAALVWSRFPYMTGNQVRFQLRQKADDLGDPGFDEYYGHGRIEARRAVEQAPSDHDLLVVNWKKPLCVRPSDTATINTTVLNFGTSDESNVRVQLLVNGTIADSAIIGFLASGISATVSCAFVPTVEGTYNVTSYIVPAPSETVTRNNVVSGYLIVRDTNVFRVPEDYLTIQAAVDATISGCGDTIKVAAGTYYENVTIEKDSLTLMGKNKRTIINGEVHVYSNNVNVSGFTIQNGFSGISIYSHGNKIINNTITNNENGLELFYSSGNTIMNNDVISNAHTGIRLVDSHYNILRDNNMTDNTFNFEAEINRLGGHSFYSFINDIDASNTVDGKPVYYWVNQSNRQVPADAGYVALVNSTRITVKDLDLAKNGQGVLLAWTSESIIENVTASNNRDGIVLEHSDNNTVRNVTLASNKETGIYLVESNSNSVIGNIITDNRDGLFLAGSVGTMIAGNTIHRSIDYGISLILFSGNVIYHNNFIDNAKHVESYVSTNTWDDGYPSGGNYWSDYTGVDELSGSHQNVTGSDGIGDTPYVIDAESTDCYPLMGMFSDFKVAWEGETYHISAISNSTISEFRFNDTAKMINFNVAGSNNTVGFCTITIPKVLLRAISLEAWTVTINDAPPLSLTITEIATHTFLHFTYGHTIHNVKIIGTAVGLTPDINDDGIVDIYDIVVAVIALGATPENPRWNPFADINRDSIVDIYDIMLIAINFGRIV